jgi:hypothetical protein
MDEQDEYLEAMQMEALRARVEARRRDPVQMQEENAAMARFAATRIRRGEDSLEKLQARVAGICANPEREAHTKWNAQNLLEQTEALLAQDSSPLPPSRRLTKEQATEITDAYRSGDPKQIEAVRTKYGVEAALEAKE